MAKPASNRMKASRGGRWKKNNLIFRKSYFVRCAPFGRGYRYPRRRPPGELAEEDVPLVLVLRLNYQHRCTIPTECSPDANSTEVPDCVPCAAFVFGCGKR